MAKCKVTEKDLTDLATLYNQEGRTAVYGELRGKYMVKNPYFVLRRMLKKAELGYDHQKDRFESVRENGNEDGVFMSMEELCAPARTVNTAVSAAHTLPDASAPDSRAVAMEKLIRELVGDRLLELSRYVTIDSLSKTVHVDQTTLTMDGYQLSIH